MKFWEIPAADGFQICDWQPALAASAHGKHTIFCRSPPEFAASIHHYLSHPDERMQLTRSAHQAVLESADYAPRLAALLQGLS
jgi:spore maturation protein CgeB